MIHCIKRFVATAIAVTCALAGGCQTQTALLDARYAELDEKLTGELKRPASECPKLSELPPDQVLDGFGCYYRIWNAAINAYVPVTEKTLWADYMLVQRRIAESVSRGEITFDDASFASDQSWTRLVAAIGEVRRFEYQRAAYADEQSRQAIGRALMATGNGLIVADQEGLAGPANSRTSGFLTREATSGLNKVCYYNVVGSTYTMNIGAADLCPLTADF